MFLLSKTLSYRFEMRSGVVRKGFGGGGYTSSAHYV